MSTYSTAGPVGPSQRFDPRRTSGRPRKKSSDHGRNFSTKYFGMR
ncbi:MAG: hypothetical protein AAGI46_01400 [Planctomycetota bacterium]